MDSVRDKVQALCKIWSLPANGNSADRKRECNVEEVSDMYGFSLISQRRENNQPPENVLDLILKDQNWNNPGAVCLMCRAYGIDDDYSSVIFGKTLSATEGTYLTVKSEQHLMFAQRYYTEGIAVKPKGLFAESVKFFSDALLYNSSHIEARIERADSLFRLNKKAEALHDYKMILTVQPHHTVALERAPLLRNNNSFISSLAASSSTGRLQLTDPNATIPAFPSSSTLSDTTVNNKNIHAKPLVYKNTGLISKLQQSLLDNPNYFDTSSSDSESDESESSDSSSGDDKSSKKRKHKSNKIAKEKRSHSDKSAKKRKSKHKKDKRSIKKKHKSDK